MPGSRTTKLYIIPVQLPDVLENYKWKNNLCKIRNLNLMNVSTKFPGKHLLISKPINLRPLNNYMTSHTWWHHNSNYLILKMKQKLSRKLAGVADSDKTKTPAGCFYRYWTFVGL